jgi:hypothetical protein
LVAAALFAFLLIPGAATAGPTDPVTVVLAPEGQGDMFSPGVRLIQDLKQDYVEEEFLVSGEATVYTYNDPPVPEVIIPQDPDVPYTTRIIVRRPENSNKFNGTVVIEWWNSTAGFDTAPVWDPSAEFYARKGWVYVGVTNSTTSLGFLVGGCRLFGFLPPTCGTRYATLSMPENGQAYEMISQIANLLKSDSPENPLPEGFDVERIFHAGQSQQGGSMVTYATAFHFPVNDGYFVQAAGNARPINFGPACGATGSDPYPDCTPRLTGSDRQVRTDLPVPVYRAQTETDMSGVIGNNSRQTDTANFRYYEMAGTAHTTVHVDIEVLPPLLFPPNGLSLEDTCLFPINTIADGPVFGSMIYNAMWQNMEDTVTSGADPPHGDLIDVAGGAIVRDGFGNALGGIRLPQMDVPIATYGPHNTVDLSLPLPPGILGLLNLFCVLTGTVTDFDAATLAALYPNNGAYQSPFSQATNTLKNQGFLLSQDSKRLIFEAAQEGP